MHVDPPTPDSHVEAIFDPDFALAWLALGVMDCGIACFGVDYVGIAYLGLVEQIEAELVVEEDGLEDSFVLAA